MGIYFNDENNNTLKEIGTCIYTSIVTDTGGIQTF